MYDGFCVVTKCGRLLNRFLPIEKAEEMYKYPRNVVYFITSAIRGSVRSSTRLDQRVRYILKRERYSLEMSKG